MIWLNENLNGTLDASSIQSEGELQHVGVLGRYLTEATIKNIVLDETCSAHTSHILGLCHGCHFEGLVNMASITYAMYIGGIVGIDRKSVV